MKTWLNCSSVRLIYLHSEDLAPGTKPRLRQKSEGRAEPERCTGDNKGLRPHKIGSFVDYIGARLIAEECVEILGVRLTPNGSFWTNDLEEIFRKNQPRGRKGRRMEDCGGNRSRSVVLTPLRHEDSFFGLLETADEQSGHFTERSVETVEEIAQFLARLRGERKRY